MMVMVMVMNVDDGDDDEDLMVLVVIVMMTNLEGTKKQVFLKFENLCKELVCNFCLLQSPPLIFYLYWSLYADLCG